MTTTNGLPPGDRVVFGLLQSDLSHGQSRSYTYDSTRHLERVDFPDGEHTTHVHDTAGRELSRTGSDGTALSWSYGPNDRVTQHADDTGTTAYTFDGAGRPDLLTAPTGATIDWDHDGRDQVTTVDVGADPAVDPRRFATGYEYDGAGNLFRITDPAGGVTDRIFDLAGRLTDIQRPNGIDTTYGYDTRNRITSVVHERSDGSVLASVSYVRGASGEPTRIEREDGSYVEIDYDPSLRIEEERFFDPAGVREETLTYGYDLDGKRTSLTRTDAAGTPTVETYVYDTGARLTAIEVAGSPIASYEYDARGRVTRITKGGAGQQLEYDIEDHLVRVIDVATGDEVRFAYDAMGRRVGRTEVSGGAITDELRWLSGPNAADGLASPHLTLDASGAPTNVYLFDDGVIGNTAPAARLDPSTDEATYYLRDAMGTVIALANDADAEGTLRYDAFGNERGSSGPLAAAGPAGDFRFHGHWADPSGLYHARARAYDPATGRFTSRDPAEGGRSRPESYAPYGFANRSPMTAADPTGRYTIAEAGSAVQIRFNLASVAVPAVRALAIACAYASATQVLMAPFGAGGGGGGCGGSSEFRVRVQSQGGKVNDGIPYVRTVPMPVSLGLEYLDQLWAMLPGKERKARSGRRLLFERARAWLRGRPPHGAPPYNYSFAHPDGGSIARVDIEVNKGVNFVSF